MATVLPAATGVVDTVNGTTPSLVILTILIVIFSAAAYFTGRLYGKMGILTVLAGFVVIVTSLYTVGAINFG